MLLHWHTPCTLQPHPTTVFMSCLTIIYCCVMHDIVWCSSSSGHAVLAYFSRVRRMHLAACTSQTQDRLFCVLCRRLQHSKVPSSPQTGRAGAGVGQVRMMCTFKAVIPYKLGFSQSGARPQNCPWPLHHHPLACIQIKQCFKQCQNRGYHTLWQIRRICQHP